VQADGDFIEMAATDRFWQTKVSRRQTPENVRLELSLRNNVLKTRVDSVEVVARNRAVQKGVAAGNNRRAENRHIVPGMMKVDTRDIKRAANVEPVGRTDYALIAKKEQLAFTGLPGEGVAWFITGFKDFKNQTAEQQKLIVGVELTRIFTYPKWDKVLAAFELKPLKPVTSDAGVEALIAKARNMRGIGEGEDHRKLKNYIAANPHVIALSGFCKGQTEQPFTSADRIDIVFRKDDHWVGVEVKGPSSSEADLLRGLFQAVKYAALREAELKVDPLQGKNEVILVMSAKLSDQLKKVKNLLGVTVLDGIVAPEEWH
jgi:hypothetical protein